MAVTNPLYTPFDPRCVCGHLPETHDIGTRSGVKVRTACSHSSGPRGTPCECRRYEPEPCPWCGFADCTTRFDHERRYNERETTWRA